MYVQSLTQRFVNVLLCLLIVAAVLGVPRTLANPSASNPRLEQLALKYPDINFSALSQPAHEIRQTIPDGKDADHFGRVGQPPLNVDEAPSPVVVTRLLATKAPAENEAIELVLEVVAYRDAPGTRAEIQLPEGAKLLEGATEGVFDLTAGKIEQLKVVVAFSAGGELTVTGRVVTEVNEDMIWTDTDSLALTVGAKQEQSFVGFASAEQAALTTGLASKDTLNLTDPALQASTEAALEDAQSSIEPSLEEADLSSGAEEIAAPELAPAEGTGAEAEAQASNPVINIPVSISICWILGSDRDGTTPPLRDARIELWDDDTFSGDDLLATSFTGYTNGCTSISRDNVDTDECCTIDAYFRVQLWRAGRYRVTNFGGGIYTCQTSTASNIGANHSFGTWWCGGGSGNDRSVRIFNDAYRTFRFLKEHALDSSMGANPGEAVIRWQTGSTDGNHYHRDLNVVHLADNGAASRDVVSHEMSHRYMDAVYGESMPPSDCPSPHFLSLVSGRRCAWIEGYTYVIVAGADANPIYTFPGGGVLNLETPHCGSANWDDGGTVEGRVGGALIDLADPFTLSFATATGFSNEATPAGDPCLGGRDEASGMFDAIWDLFSDQNDQVFVTNGSVTDSFSNAWEARQYPRRSAHLVGHLNSIFTFTHD